MRYSVLIRLSGSLAAATAVEWTDRDAPGADGAGWQPCLRLDDGSWRMSSRDGEAVHLREPGPFGNIAIRYRLSEDGPWSPASADRKAIDIVAVPDEPEPDEPEPDEPEQPLPVAPVLVLPPALAGTGTIGTEVTVEPGTWAGDPAPALALQWLCDGEAIEGATEAVYVPGPADDRRALACAVTATNAAGSERVVTAALAVAYAPPTLTGALTAEDVFVFDEDTGPQTIETAAAFAGEALVFSAEGAGAAIDAATGVVTIPTETPVDGAAVTVAAENSGGAVSVVFTVTVEAFEGVESPLEIGPANAEIMVGRNLDPEAEGLHIGLRITDAEHPLHPARGGIGQVAWTGADPADRDPVDSGNKAVRAAGFADPASPGYGVWALTRRSNGATVAWADRSNEIGARFTITVNWAPEDPAATPMEAATWLGWGATFPAFTIPQPESPPQPAPPRPPATAGGSKRMPQRVEAEYQAYRANGYIGGDSLQLMTGTAQSRSNPDVIVVSQDVAGHWLSLDGGKSFWKPRSKGLLSRLANDVGIDPADAAHWLCAMQGEHADSTPFAGIYETRDMGVTFELKLPLEIDGKTRGRGIDGSPASVQNGRAQRWYMLINTPDGRSSSNGPIRFCRSTDGGATVTLVRQLDHVQYGFVYDVSCHPTEVNTFYFTSSTGFWRVTNAHQSNPTLTRLSGSGGLPNGSYITLPYLELVGGQVHIILGRGQGVFRSTNGGNSWSQISSRGVNNLWVSRFEPNWMIDVNGDNNTARTVNGGSSWQNVARTAFERRPGYGTQQIPGTPFLAFFPNRAGEVFMRGTGVFYDNNSCWFRSTDYGATWKLSMDYFSGNHSQHWQSNGMCFHPTNGDVFAIPCIDTGMHLTTTRGRWFHRSGLRPAQDLTGSGRRRTVHAGAIHPEWGRGGRHTMLAAMQVHTQGSLGATRDPQNNDWFEPGPAATRSPQRGPAMVYDYDDPRWAYWSRFRSNQHGEGGWSEMDALPSDFRVWGITRTANNGSNGQVVYAVEDSGRRSRVARSLNRGNAWSQVLDMDAHSTPPGAPNNAQWGLQNPNAPAGAFLPHPSERDVLFTRGPRWNSGGGRWNAHHIIRWRLGQGSPSNRPHDVIRIPQSLLDEMVPGGHFFVERFAVDPRHPDDVMYFSNYWAGTGVALVRYAFGRWENISHLGPDNGRTWMDCSPVTGDLIFGSPNGIFVAPPPYAQANTIYDALEQPGRILLQPPR